MSSQKICHKCEVWSKYDWFIDGGVHRCRCGRKYRCEFRPWPKWGHDWVEMFSWKRLKDWVTGK